MQIKVKALGHRKKTVKQLVSSGAPRQFHEFLSWFKVGGQIIVNFIRLYFLKRLESAECSTQLHGKADKIPSLPNTEAQKELRHSDYTLGLRA